MQWLQVTAAPVLSSRKKAASQATMSCSTPLPPAAVSPVPQFPLGPGPHRCAEDSGVWWPDSLAPLLQWEGDFIHDKLGMAFNPFMGVAQSTVVDHFTERLPGSLAAKEDLRTKQRLEPDFKWYGLTAFCVRVDFFCFHFLHSQIFYTYL